MSQQDSDEQNGFVSRRADAEPAGQAVPPESEPNGHRQTADIRTPREAVQAIASGAAVLGRSWLGVNMVSLARTSARTMVASGLVVPLLGFMALMLGIATDDLEWWVGLLTFIGSLIIIAPFLGFATIVWHAALIAEQLRLR